MSHIQPMGNKSKYSSESYYPDLCVKQRILSWMTLISATNVHVQSLGINQIYMDYYMLKALQKNSWVFGKKIKNRDLEILS